MARGALVKRGRTWSAVIPLERDAATGKKRQRWITLKATTEQEAETELTRLMAQHDVGTLPKAPAKLTAGEYLRRWLTEGAKVRVTAKTYQGYEQVVERLTLVLGARPLAKLTPLDVQRAYTTLREQGRQDDRGPLSSTTLLYYHRVLHRALAQAVKWDLIGRNVADAVEAPRKQHHEIRPPEETTVMRLFDAFRGMPVYLPVVLAVTAGARRGEILALMRTDADLNRRRMTIRRSLEQTKLRLAFKPPKSGKSRAVALPPIAVEALRAHLVEQERTRRAAGPAYHDQGLLIARPDGSPWRPDSFSSRFRQLAKRAGFSGFSFHDLRHAHATYLMGRKIALKVVSERLGHASTRITADLYQHVMGGMDDEAADTLDAALRVAAAKVATALVANGAHEPAVTTDAAPAVVNTGGDSATTPTHH